MKNLIAFFNDTFPLSDKVLSLMGEFFVFEELKKGEYFIRIGYCKSLLH
jgi:hypothetical protein